MKEKKILKLKPKDQILHKQFGVCKVDKLLFGMGGLFGVQIIPINFEGLDLLRHLSGMPDGTPLLEAEYNLIIKKL